ncbi:sulfotransferase [Blastococcus sp. SYSU DS1024]
MSSPSIDGAPAPAAHAGGRARVLYLGGLGRSGTTVLERVLGELPGVCSVGEVVHLWQRGVLDDETCGCGEPFSRCSFWTEVGAVAFGGWDRALAARMVALRAQVDRSRHIPRLLRSRGRRRDPRLAEYVGAYRTLYRAISQVSGGAVVIDSSKHSSLAFCLRTAPDLDLRVVHVVRDPRGVAYSWTKEVRRPEAGGEALMTRYSPTRSSALWVGHNVFFGLLRRLGTPTRRLRYEDFVARPGVVVEDLAVFAGLPAGSGTRVVDGHSVVLSPAHTVAGNPMRFRTGPLTLRRDDAWRTELPTGDKRLVGALTLPLLAVYGYLRRAAR